MSLQIQLEKFEGPLDLLLYLIRKEEMDIFDIPIHLITKQYLEYIRLMKELDLDVASEFIAMAATLIQIKSRMLLPTYDENGEIVETEDPRKELVQRLLEYEKYKEAAKLLYERPLVGRDMWVRGIREKLHTEEQIELEENALFALISAYRTALRTAKKKIHKVGEKAQSIASRILELKDKLFVGVRSTLSELIDSVSERRRQVLITFLSLLELGKMGFVHLSQVENYQEIYIETKKQIETDVINRVEEYDNLKSEEVAMSLGAMQKLEGVDMADVNVEVSDSAAETEDFVLKDAEDFVLENEEVAEFDSSEMATDEEIAAAEAELAAIEVETRASSEDFVVESSLIDEGGHEQEV